MVEGMPRQPVGRQWRLSRIRRWKRGLVGMIRRTVRRQQLGRAIPRVVRMGEPEVDEEGIRVAHALPLLEVRHHLVAVPGTAAFRSALALRRVATDAKQRISRLVGVALLAGPHRVVAGALEHRRHREPLEAGWAVAGSTPSRSLRPLRPARPDRQVPHRAAAHHHVPARRADRARKRAHVVGGIEYHPLGGESLDHRSPERRGGVIQPEVKRRLVVDDDVEDVGPAGRRVRGRRGNRHARGQARKRRTEAASHRRSFPHGDFVSTSSR